MRFTTVLALLLATSAGAQDLNWEPFDFATRSGEKVAGAELGFLDVPENHENPSGRRIELAMVRLPATASNPGYPIVYLAGGPGGSGIELARGGRFPLFQALRAFGDVIALDQRGAGRSRPSLACPDALDIPLDSAPDYESLLGHYRKQIEACAAHFRAEGIDLAQYNTDASADDLELLRQGLGADKLRFVGMSYGTHLGLAMLRRHEQSVERIVLAGVEGPDHSLKLPSTVEAGLDHVASMLASDPATARLIPDLRGLIGYIIAELEEQPVTATTTDPRTGEVVDIVIGPLDMRFLASAAISRRDTVTFIPRLFLPAAAGDFDMIASFILGMRRDDLNLMGLAMDAASHASAERLNRIAKERKFSLLHGVLDFPFPDLRDTLGIPALPDSYRNPVQTNIPTLFISGTLDFRTPIANTEEVLRGFPRHEHVIVEGAGHDDSLLVGSPEILAAIEAFFRRKAPPKSRIVLPPIQFVLPPATASSAQRILLEHASVFAPSGMSWLEDHSILIEGDRIIRVDASDAIDVDRAVRRIDASGQFIIPGLHDMHVHISKMRRPALPLFIYHGVTSVRDLGGELDEVRGWQRAIRSGQLAGPRIKMVGSYFEQPGNIERMLRDKVVEPVERTRFGIRGPEHARQVVAELAARGVDGIKMRTCIDEATYYAIGEAAAAAGLPFYGHAEGSMTPEHVLRAGQDSIEHGFFPPLATTRPEAELEALYRAMAARGVVLVPTLTVWTHSIFADLEEARAVLSGDSAGRLGLRPFVSAYTIADWQEQLVERTPEAQRLYRSIVPRLRQDIMTMKTAGMKVLPGSDTAVLLIQPGASLLDELVLFVEELSMSPAEVIQAATIDCAEFLGLDRDLGKIVSGMQADLVVLNEDPLVDIQHIRSVHGVLAAGRWYGPAERAALLDAIRDMSELTVNDWKLPERGQ